MVCCHVKLKPFEQNIMIKQSTVYRLTPMTDATREAEDGARADAHEA